MFPNPPLWLVLVAFVCALGPLIFFHELGHYLVARWFRIPAEVFSIGFGREIVGWTDRQGTRWKVGWLPLGGYVRFVGDMSPASNPAEESAIPPELRDKAFPLRPVWQRFLVVLAGPAANFLLAILIFAGIFSLVSSPSTNRIGRVEANSPAAAAGLKPGDRILAVAGQETPTFDEMRSLVASRPNQVVRIEFEREGAVREVDTRIRAERAFDVSGKETTIGLLGVAAAPISIVKAVPLATAQTVRITGWIVEGVARFVTGQASREEVGGPIKIAQFTGQAASLGVLPFLQLLALLSINLGFINLLPVPVLDGGHLFFYAVEAVRRRPISARALDWAFRGGIAVILALIVFTTVNDLDSVGLWDRLQRLIG